jgi:hypothetical protein
MPSIPIDVLLLILEHADKSSLAKICLLNKICCSCSQDILYRNIRIKKPSDSQVYQTLAQSTHLARRVRSFEMTYYNSVEQHELLDLKKSLQNMTCLRILRHSDLSPIHDVLEECTFRLVEFACCVYSEWEPVYQFLLSQPGLTVLELKRLTYYDFPEFEATFLPNLTRITAPLYFLQRIIPYRPVNEVICTRPVFGSFDSSFFKLSTAPIKKLTIDCSWVYPIPGHFTSIFSSLTLLEISANSNRFPEIVRELPLFIYLSLIGLS